MTYKNRRLRAALIAGAIAAFVLFAMACGNQVANPGFVDNNAGWAIVPVGVETGDLAWDGAISADDTGGSQRLENTTPGDLDSKVQAYYCVTSAAPGFRYAFSGSFLVPTQESDGLAELRYEFFTGGDCTGSLTFGQTLDGSVVGPSGLGWQTKSGAVLAPEGAGSVYVGFGVTNRAEETLPQISFTAWVDNVVWAPMFPQAVVAHLAGDGP